MNEQPAAIVFCERLDNESFCESIVRELGAYYEVRPCGPGWPTRRLEDVPLEGVRFYLELDSASGEFHRPTGLDRLTVPRFAWLVDTHKKPGFHRSVAQSVDLAFFAMKNWGHVFDGLRARWLPLHADTKLFKPTDAARDLDLVFVGSHEWRAEPMLRIAKKHGLAAHVACTTGAKEKSETAALYARSKLVFNRHVANDLNFRVFEATACGRVLLTDAQWNGQYELFRDQEHLCYYKDEADLERLVLELLADDARRARIEGAAAAHAEARHSSRARVRELRDAIEDFVAPEPIGLTIEEPRRWLFFTDGEPGPVTRRTYAERLADGLAARGHDVTVVHERRHELAVPDAPGRARVREVDLAALPETHLPVNERLRACASLHGQLARLARGQRFDAIVGEGPRGALVAQPLARRSETPFLLALPTCEVALRSNRRSADQLYLAGLEGWGAERAHAVVVPDDSVAAAVRTFYESDLVVIAAPPPHACSSPDATLLLARLGIDPGVPFALVLGGAGAERTLTFDGLTLLLVTDTTWLVGPGSVRQLGTTAPTGSVLAALAARAVAVVALDPRDARLDEIAELGVTVAVARARRADLVTLARHASVKPLVSTRSRRWR